MTPMQIQRIAEFIGRLSEIGLTPPLWKRDPGPEVEYQIMAHRAYEVAKIVTLPHTRSGRRTTTRRHQMLQEMAFPTRTRW